MKAAGASVKIPGGLDTARDLSETRWVKHVSQLAHLWDRPYQAGNATKYALKAPFFKEGMIQDNWKYLSGLMAADGHIATESVTLSLNENDRELLDRIAIWLYGAPRNLRISTKPEFNCDGTIKEDGKTYVQMGFSIGGYSFLMLLRDLLGCWTTNKTRTLEPMHFLICDPHFLRGFIDGDGSVFPKYTSGKTSHNIQLVSASTETFIPSLRGALKSHWGVECGVYKAGDSEVTKVMSVHGDDAAKLAKALYKPALVDTDLLSMRRKTAKAAVMMSQPSKHLRPIKISRLGENEIFPTYISAGRFIAAKGNPETPHKILSVKRVREEISARFTKANKSGQKVEGWTLSVPSIEELESLLGVTISDLDIHAPWVRKDLQARSCIKRRLSLRKLAPFLLRKPSCPYEEYFFLTN